MNKPNTWQHKGEQAKTPLHYTECGLDDVYLVSGYVIENTPDGEALSVKNLDELHKAIGCYLAMRKKTLSGKELRFLRRQMDLTQSDLGKLVGLTSQQIARWEKDESEISGPAERLLRGLYIQHAGGTLDLQKLVTMLDEIDSPTNEKTFFEKTSQGWRYKKAA